MTCSLFSLLHKHTLSLFPPSLPPSICILLYYSPILSLSFAGYVAELALTYGNACNPILRAAACSYQAIVLGMDCSQ